MPPKKKQRMLFHSSDVIRSGLQKSHGGKRILLKASLIYSKGNIPAGEKHYLFQYSIRTINSDCSTSIMDFDKRLSKSMIEVEQSELIVRIEYWKR